MKRLPAACRWKYRARKFRRLLRRADCAESGQMDEPAVLNFETAARSVLSFLHRRLGFDLWMVTRTDGEDWIVLHAEDHGYNVTDGTVFRWADSFCSRMVVGLGPRIAPRSDDIPAYASAPIGQQVKIGAYVGVALRGADGGLFGTLCAIDPHAQPASITQDQELLDMLGTLLSGLLQTEMDFASEARRVERAEAEAFSDGLTGIFNRRGWTRLLAGEEQRCRRYGHPAGVIAVDSTISKSSMTLGGTSPATNCSRARPR